MLYCGHLNTVTVFEGNKALNNTEGDDVIGSSGPLSLKNIVLVLGSRVYRKNARIICILLK